MKLINYNTLKTMILEERDKIPKTLPAAPYELIAEKPNHAGNLMRGGIRKALRCLEQCPSENVAMQDAAHWVSVEVPESDGVSVYHKCSHCAEFALYDNDGFEKCSDWCPCCGFSMGGGNL